MAIAELHADSWRRHYRFAYPPEFFGDSLDEDRRSTWTSRLSTPAGTHTAVAELGGQLVGFAHVVLGEDATWGALVDNLHVRHDVQRSGIGGALLGAAAAEVQRDDPSAGIHLWVLEGNTRGRAFYAGLGGREVEAVPAAPPALPGIKKIRCVWPAAVDLTHA